MHISHDEVNGGEPGLEKAIRSAWPAGGGSVALTSWTRNGLYMAIRDFWSLFEMKNYIFVSPGAATFAISQSVMGSYPEVLTLKVSQRSRVVCWENVQQCLTLWLREEVLTQKYPLGREGCFCCRFKLCAAVSSVTVLLQPVLFS